MEIAVAVFLGLWMSAAGALAYGRIRRELRDQTDSARAETEDK